MVLMVLMEEVLMDLIPVQSPTPTSFSSTVTPTQTTTPLKRFTLTLNITLTLTLTLGNLEQEELHSVRNSVNRALMDLPENTLVGLVVFSNTVAVLTTSTTLTLTLDS